MVQATKIYSLIGIFYAQYGRGLQKEAHGAEQRVCIFSGDAMFQNVSVLGNLWTCGTSRCHYSDVMMGAMASEIPSLTIVYSTVYSGADQRKHQSSTSLAFVRGIHQWPVTSPHKWPVTRKMFPLDDVIMVASTFLCKQMIIGEKYTEGYSNVEKCWDNVCYSNTFKRWQWIYFLTMISIS